MASKFKCKLSGCIVEFQHIHDIEAMKQHPDYEEVVAPVVTEPVVVVEDTPVVKQEPTPVVVRRAGRPKKV